MTVYNRCTAQNPRGNFCDAEAMEGAPYPICFRHGSRVWAFFNLAVENKLTPKGPPPKPTPPRKGEPGYIGPVVYYVDWGRGRVKIGYTTDLPGRMRQLSVPIDHILAVEPGTFADEAKRHLEFGEERVDSSMEIFQVSERVAEHIAQVSSANPDLIALAYGRRLDKPTIDSYDSL